MDKALNKVIKRQVILAVFSGVAIICLMLTITYGLYQKNHTNTLDQEIAVGDFDVDLTSNSGQITLADLKPGDEPNTSYTFTTSNSGDYIVNYNVYLTDNTTTFMQDSTNASTYSGYTSITSENYQYINFQINDGVVRSLSEVYNSSTGKFNILGGILVPDETYTYSIKFSVASNAPNSIQGNILALNITMDASATKETGASKIRQLVTGSSTSSTDVITKQAPTGASCTNTLVLMEQRMLIYVMLALIHVII